MANLLRRYWLSAVVLLVGVGFMVLGVLRGEVSTVLTKAINICLECIGIG